MWYCCWGEPSRGAHNRASTGKRLSPNITETKGQPAFLHLTQRNTEIPPTIFPLKAYSFVRLWESSDTQNTLSSSKPSANHEYSLRSSPQGSRWGVHITSLTCSHNSSSASSLPPTIRTSPHHGLRREQNGTRSVPPPNLLPSPSLTTSRSRKTRTLSRSVRSPTPP